MSDHRNVYLRKYYHKNAPRLNAQRRKRRLDKAHEVQLAHLRCGAKTAVEMYDNVTASLQSLLDQLQLQKSRRYVLLQHIYSHEFEAEMPDEL
ncbi:hypothetical protein DFQ30_009451 [Apophysomyces sp. BC1015]|nr:hypothetical protein DFQ30_009451 [Apophysomyces sp. BC1015]KAG0172380.1 hypothetical protein DFQ29_008408 [Apophysomyces sp. BC1021]